VKVDNKVPVDQRMDTTTKNIACKTQLKKVHSIIEVQQLTIQGLKLEYTPITLKPITAGFK